MCKNGDIGWEQGDGKGDLIDLAAGVDGSIVGEIFDDTHVLVRC
jgi:hypothetical protein